MEPRAIRELLPGELRAGRASEGDRSLAPSQFRLSVDRMLSAGPLPSSEFPLSLVDGDVDMTSSQSSNVPAAGSVRARAPHDGTERNGLPDPLPTELCLFGAAADTGNLGVSALMESVVAGVGKRAPSAAVTVFDSGWRMRTAELPLEEGQEFTYFLCGARLSRRLYKSESFLNMAVASRLRVPLNAGLEVMRSADAVLDVSGGDSFGDLYGDKRYRGIVAPKRLALREGKKLVLLPQTYGPFARRANRQLAVDLVRGAHAAWARDDDSFEALRELLGEAYDPERHHNGVDVAFSLPAQEPRTHDGRLTSWFADSSQTPVLGLNVSGLIYSDPLAGEKYGLQLDYRKLIHAFLDKVLEEGVARVLLVPHVVAPATGVDSDAGVCEHIAASLPPAMGERVMVSPEGLTAGETKWVIANCDWFFGTRMHSTLAALSSGVPAAALAYSLKTRGVFGTCGLDDQVVEARSDNTQEALARVWASWKDRDVVGVRLAKALPHTLHRAEQQLDVILRSCVPV